MNGNELALVLLFSLSILIFIVVVINAVIFYMKFYDSIALKVDGKNQDIGFLLSASRFMLWGQYCLLPKLSRNPALVEIFDGLTKTQRFCLQCHFIGVALGCIGLVTGWLLISG